jgi:hypothetical protein
MDVPLGEEDLVAHRAAVRGRGAEPDLDACGAEDVGAGLDLDGDFGQGFAVNGGRRVVGCVLGRFGIACLRNGSPA